MNFDMTGQVIFHGQLFSNNHLKNLEAIVLKKISGLKQGEKIALAMERTPLMLVTLFALLKKGIPFLPINTSFPMERLEYMLYKAEIKTILSDSKGTICGRKTVYLPYPKEAYFSEVKDSNVSEKTEDISEDETAYILFTSGTMGLPKAVDVLRKGLKNFIEGIVEKVIFPQDCRIACITNMTFDIFFLESILALNAGMTIVLADENERNNPRLIKKLIDDNKVNVMQCTPSTMRMLEMIDSEYGFLQNMETLMIGGEPFPPTLLATLRNVMPGRIYNMYGPTETTIWSTLSDLTEAKEVNIGKPIKNTEVYIVDEELKLVPEGEEGEIVIAGVGLARGYLHDKERTEKAFISLKMDLGVIRAYRTGDFGYVGSNRDYFCTGRRDDQVKVLGHRIELGDVEHHIGRIPGIRSNVVIADPEDANRLMCFYLSDEEIKESDLRKEALELLPDYMVPNNWVRVEELLYTASDKIDRKSMLAKYRNTEQKCKEEKREDKADDILRILKEVFEFTGQAIEPDTVLKSLGVDSIKYISVIVELEEVFDIDFEDEMLSGDYFTVIQDLTDYIREVTKI